MIAQTASRLDGEMPARATRVVSLHDTDVRPIRKGRLGRSVVFGYKAQVLDNVDGIVLDHEVMTATHPMRRCSHRPSNDLKSSSAVSREPTADRGYGEANVDRALAALGVRAVVIPRKGRAGGERRKLQTSKGFMKLVKWRTGSEGRISHLQQSWGWMEPHSHRRHRRRTHVVRLGRARSQRHQDRGPRRSC